MSYFAPYVDETGLHYPSYNDIIEDLTDKMQEIYGSGIYLGQDSQDYQMLSVIADKIHDTYQAMEIAYNAHSPVSAIGSGLDYIVAINGIKRKVGTASTAELVLTGSAGTAITNGIAADAAGNLWDLPANVTIGYGGTVTVVATCQQVGVVQAAANTITQIMTPTRGWESVTNPNPATTGVSVEADSALRARRELSVAQPSMTVLSGLKGALMALDDVSRCVVFENDTASTDANGIPAHSICCVVEGGVDDDIAQTILMRKTPGVPTYGSESVTVYGEDGQSNLVKFSRVTYVDIDVQVNITRRAGYSSATASEIAAAIVTYLNGFGLGMDLATSMLWMVAQQVDADVRNPTFSVTQVKAARHGSTLSTSDVQIAYNEVARGNVLNITVVVA